MEKNKLYLIKTKRVKDIRNPVRIDYYLKQHFPDTTRNSFQKQIRQGLIRVNEQIVDKGYRVKIGETIRIFSPFKSKLAWIPNPEIKPRVVFEDDVLLVLDKPAGIQVHPATGNYDNTLINGLVAYLEDSNLRPFLVHRLDKFTEGLMVFAKSKTIQEKLGKQFKQGIAGRKYKALVWGRLREPGTIDKPIGRDKQKSPVFRVYDSDEKDGKTAVTHFEIDREFAFHSLVSCKLETGRTHQIRVHFQSLGCPLVGDFEYGGNKILKGLNNPQYLKKMDELLALFKGQALVANELEFKHPISGEQMNFKLDLPDAFVKAIEILEVR